MPDDSPNLPLRYGAALGGVALAILARALLAPALGDQFPYAPLFLAVLFAAWYGGLGPAVVATALGGLASTYFFVLPRGQLFPTDPPQQVGLGLYLAVGVGLAGLAAAMRASWRRAERKHRESEERFRVLVDGVQDYALCLLDTEGRVTTWNAGAERIHGYRAEEIVGQPFTRFHTPEERAAGEPGKELAAALAEGRLEVEGWRVRKDGSRFWADVVVTPLRDQDGRPRGFAEVTRDVTDRKWAEEALRKSERLLHAALENVSEGVILAGLDGRLRYWNRAALEMHGLSTSEEGQRLLSELGDCYQLFTLAGRPVGLDDWPMARVLRGERLASHELRVRSPEQGWERVFRYGGSLIADVEGRQLAFLTVLDVTRQKRDEQALRRHADELAQQVAENETFVYSVSHDLRSPLVNLQGFSRELDLACQEVRSLLSQEGVPGPVRQRGLAVLDQDVAEALHFIRSGVSRLAGIIDALLRLSRAGRVEYQWQEVDVAAVVARVVESMRGTVGERGASVTVGELPPAWGDPTALEQAFANLIGNALNYLDPGRPGRVEVGCQGPAQDGWQTYWVRDNGLGIPEAYRDNVFRAFRRLHPERAKGEGMGLAIVRRVVERHRGKAWVESSPGQGSTFFVSLPAGPFHEGGRSSLPLARAGAS